MPGIRQSITTTSGATPAVRRSDLSPPRQTVSQRVESAAAAAMNALRERRQHRGVRSGDGNAGANRRALPARARKRQPAAKRLDSIAEAAQAAAVRGARSAHAIVG